MNYIFQLRKYYNYCSPLSFANISPIFFLIQGLERGVILFYQNYVKYLNEQLNNPNHQLLS